MFIVFVLSFPFFFFWLIRHGSAEERFREFDRRLSTPAIGNDGKIYACSEKDLFAFHSNGSIFWTIHLNYTCNADRAPIYGGKDKVQFLSCCNVVSFICLHCV